MNSESNLGTHNLAQPVFVDKSTTLVTSNDKSLIKSLSDIGIKLIFGKNCGGGNLLTYDNDCEDYGNFTIFFNGNKNHAIIAGKTLPSGNLYGRVDFVGNNSACIITERSIQSCRIKIHLWGNDSFFYWGPRSYANDVRFEIQGDNRHIIVTGDSIFSDNIWVSNSDMHPIFDLATGQQINQQVDILFEKEVWVGRDVGILCAERIGHGSIIGAKSLVKTNVDPQSCYAGIPAKKIRGNVIWGAQTKTDPSSPNHQPSK